MYDEYHDLIPNCLLLHLEAGRNLETFIVSTFGYKPSSSTDTNNRKTAIRTKLKSLSLFNESEKWKIPSAAPSRLRRPWAPPTDSIVPFGAQPKFSLQVQHLGLQKNSQILMQSFRYFQWIRFLTPINSKIHPDSTLAILSRVLAEVKTWIYLWRKKSTKTSAY